MAFLPYRRTLKMFFPFAWRPSSVLPPLAVIDKSCGSFLIVLVLTLLGWIPGINHFRNGICQSKYPKTCIPLKYLIEMILLDMCYN